MIDRVWHLTEWAFGMVTTLVLSVLMLALISGLPFLVIGCGMAYSSFRTLARYHSARSWAEVPAQLTEVKLNVNSEVECTTYSVACTYEYDFQGRRYLGKRAGLFDFSDNVGSWHQDVYARLAAAREDGQVVSCYVNPARPDDAVLIRELRYGLLAFTMGFATLFGSAGLALGLATIMCLRECRGNQTSADVRTDESRPQEPDGARSVPRRVGLDQVAIPWAVAVYWNLVSLPLWIVGVGGLFGPDRNSAATILLYPLVGLGILVYAVILTRRALHAGRSVVEIAATPVGTGGDSTATVH